MFNQGGIYSNSDTKRKSNDSWFRPLFCPENLENSPVLHLRKRRRKGMAKCKSSCSGPILLFGFVRFYHESIFNETLEVLDPNLPQMIDMLGQRAPPKNNHSHSCKVKIGTLTSSEVIPKHPNVTNPYKSDDRVKPGPLPSLTVFLYDQLTSKMRALTGNHIWSAS